MDDILTVLWFNPENLTSHWIKGQYQNTAKNTVLAAGSASMFPNVN